MRLFLITFLYLVSYILKASDSSTIESFHKQAYQLLNTDLDAAMVLADSSLRLAQEAGLNWEEANSYYIKGYIYGKNNQLSKAFVMYLKSARILEALKDEKSSKTYTSVMLNSGKILRKFHKYDEAIECYERGIKVAVAWGQQLDFQMTKLNYNKAYCLREKGNQPQALQILKEVSKQFFEQERNTYVIKSFNLLGLVHKDGGYYTAAREYYDYILNHEKASAKDKAQAYHNIAVTYREEKNMAKAEAYYAQALALEETLEGEEELLFRTLHDLSDLYLVENRLDEAKSYALQCEALFPNVISEPETYDVYHLLTNIHLTTANLEKVDDYHQLFFQSSAAYINVQQALLSKYKQFQMDLIMAGFEAEELANQEQRNARTYLLLAFVGVFLAIFVWIGWKVWFDWHRRQIGRKVAELDRAWQMIDEEITNRRRTSTPL